MAPATLSSAVPWPGLWWDQPPPAPALQLISVSLAAQARPLLSARPASWAHPPQMPLVRLLSLAGEPRLSPSFPNHPDPLKSLPCPPSPASQPQPSPGLIFSPRPCPSLLQGCPPLPTTAFLTVLPSSPLVETDTTCATSPLNPGAPVPSTTSSGPAVHHEMILAGQARGLAQVPGGHAQRPPEETSRYHTQEARGMRSRAEA